MNIKYFAGMFGSICVGFSATSLTLAQPVITAQPTNQFLASEATATFRVSATGTAPLTYQWLFEGTAISNANSVQLSIAGSPPAQWGDYSVVVSNSTGSVTSQVAELKVFVPAPHELSGIQIETNGSASLNFSGETTAPFAPYFDLYPLEASSNLVSWTPLALVQRTNEAVNILNFMDTNAAMFSQRFYRTPTNQLETPDPQPTGPYPVGTFAMLLTNTIRSNAQFMVSFWYPSVAQAGVVPAKYVEPQVALGGTYVNFGSQVEAFYSHSLSNAPMATNSAIYPVVLYDPGYGGHRRENTDKVEELASWGYVMVGLDASDTSVSVFPNGTVVDGQKLDSDVSDDILTEEYDAAIEGRLLDMQFVLDELESLNAGDPRLSGRLNLEEIGAFGWSIGGATAAQLCRRDPRCKAGAGLDGSFFETNLLTQSLNVPFLYFDEDDPIPNPNDELGEDIPDDRLEVYNGLVTNAYWVKLVSTVHGSFCDYGLVFDSVSLESSFGTPMSGQFLPGARISQIVRAYLLSFFNKSLQGEDNHLLNSPSPAYPEVMQFLSTDSNSVAPTYPTTTLVQGSDGNFYGTSEYGGTNGQGTVFRMTTNGTLTTLVSFIGTNGSHPLAALVQGSDGNFYGTTEHGGTNGNNGTVFQMTPVGALTTLVSFNGTNGRCPFAALVQGTNGNFYGTTILGGASGLGTVFEMTSGGVLSTLVSFNGANGNYPVAGLVLSTDGNFYGTAQVGGNLSLNYGAGYGTVFEMTSAGTLTTLVSFNGANGAGATAGLVQGTNGNFYGTTFGGGNVNFNPAISQYGFSTVFKMTSAGGLTTLFDFNGTNGGHCVGGLVQGNDGNFYGTTEGGGSGGGGTVFKLTATGILTTLVAFNGANGSGPAAGLVQGTDGNFYGTTEYGGAGGLGTVFKVTSTGVLTTLVAFVSNSAL